MSASRTSERAAIVAKPAAPAAAVAAVSKPAEDDPDEELRRFQQEMAQLDEDGNGDEERPGTPECAEAARLLQPNKAGWKPSRTFSLLAAVAGP